MVGGGKGPPGQQRPRADLQETGEAPMNEGHLQVTFGGMLAGWAVPALAALNVHAQQTSNLSSTVEPGVPYLPPVPSRVCGVRRASMARARTSPPINGDSHSACCSGVPCTTIGHGPKMVMSSVEHAANTPAFARPTAIIRSAEKRGRHS